jgi:hypothetical protein
MKPGDEYMSQVLQLIRRGYLSLDNTPLALPTQPPGVQVLRASWKLTP